MVAFADHVLPQTRAHLLLAGPTAAGVADDPEAGRVLGECFAAWQQLSPNQRARIHLACLPMHDVDENAAIVNALQRRSTVIVQKSLAEGFGLTVAEAMWKGRPVVASAVGGLQDQIEHGVSGELIADPRDLAGFGPAFHNCCETTRCGGRWAKPPSSACESFTSVTGTSNVGGMSFHTWSPHLDERGPKGKWLNRHRPSGTSAVTR